MKAIMKLRLLSLIILSAYTDRIKEWAFIYYVNFDDNGLPIYVYIRWAFYRAVFPWVIRAALPPNYTITSIEEIRERTERYSYFCVGVTVNVN